MIGSIDIRRHPFSMVTTFIAACLFIILVAIVCFMLLPTIITNQAAADTVASLILFILTAGCIAVVYVIDRVYWSNYLVLAEDRLIYYMRYSLLDRRAHQISLSDIADVTVHQKGNLANFINFGTLVISLNNGMPDLRFTSCNDPNFYAQEILRVKYLYTATQQVEPEPAHETLKRQDLPIGLDFLSGRLDDEEIDGM